MSNDLKVVLICGDIHGDFDVIPDYIKKHELSNVIVLQCGDFGIGFANKYKEIKRLEYLSKRLDCYNSKLFVLRGNHDDPSYFTSGEYNITDNVVLLKDYQVFNINGFNYLPIGGGISIDRTNRWKWKSGYWKDEIINYSFIVEELTDINVVLSHSAPSFVSPLLKDNINYWIARDENLNNDLNLERNTLTKIYENLVKNNNISHWYYGHFHFSNIEYYNKTKFHLLNINEIIEHK
jgi:hypothetical protein